MTKSAPSTARKLEWTKVSSRSSTRHFLPTSLGWIAPSNFGRAITLECFGSTLSSDSCVALLVNLLDDDLCECSRSALERQQHIIRKLSTKVSHGSSIMSLVLPWLLLSLSSSSRLLLAIVLVAGDDRFSLVLLRAALIACADRGVVALPLASVWVIKSGMATCCSAVGDLGIPGDRRSLLPRIPLGVEGPLCS